MEGSSNPNESQKPNPSDYEEEVRNFRKEASLTREIQENYKREALRKCNDLHAKLLDCYEHNTSAERRRRSFGIAIAGNAYSIEV